MAISIISQPNSLHPAYNDVNYVVDSTNKNEPNFRYLFDIYDEAGSTLLKRYRVAPRPGDFYGEINLSSFVSSYLKFDVLGTYTNGALTANNSQFKYTVKVGEEYSETWDYDIIGSQVSVNPFLSGKVKLSSTSNLHSYIAGDVIKINQVDSGLLYPLIEGLHTILFIENSQTICIDVNYVDINYTINISGTTQLANNNTTKFPNLNTISGKCAFNGSYNYFGILNYNEADYKTNTSSTATKFLTTQPDNFKITPAQDLFINFSYYQSSGASTVFRVQFENSNGDVFQTGNINISQVGGNRPWIRQINCGATVEATTTLTLISGTAGLIKPTTTWYSFTLVNNGNIQLIEEKVVYLDRRCGKNSIQLLFLDKLGSFSSFSFSLNFNESIKSNKLYYNRTLDLTNSNGLFDGDVSYNSTVDRLYILNTNWMTEAENTYFAELISSPIVLMRMDSSSEYFPVNILTQESEILKEKNTTRIRKTIEVKSAFGEKINI